MDIITGEILKLHNWPDGKIIGLAKHVAAQLADQGLDRETILAHLDAVRQNPGPFLADEQMADLARECIRISQPERLLFDAVRETPLQYPIWGRENIDDGSVAQMDNAMVVPKAVARITAPSSQKSKYRHEMFLSIRGTNWRFSWRGGGVSF